MKVVDTICETCDGQGKIYRWGRIAGTDLPTREAVCTCHTCHGDGHVPYVMFTLDEAKAILGKCGIGERYETNT